MADVQQRSKRVIGPETWGQCRPLFRTGILVLIAAAAVSSRLFSVIRFESIIHEFDPWFNYRATKYLVENENGFSGFWDWFDDRTWYPLGRVTGGTLYPGLMVTSGIIYHLLRLVHLPVDIRNICVLLAPAFSGLTAYATYLLTSEMTDAPSAGLLGAAFIAIAPGYISRSVAGSYDNEAIAIFLLVFTFYLWIKAVKLGSVFWAALTALSYGYMVSSWGGYAFITNMIPLHVLALLLMGRMSDRLYSSYTAWYAIGTLASMQIPFVGFLPIKTSEHMAALGVFGLLQLVAFSVFVRDLVKGTRLRVSVQAVLIPSFAVCLGALVLLTAAGVVTPWTGRFYSLFDTAYAKIHIPIIASVSEHQPTAWPSFFFDLHFLIWLFPAGVFMCFQELRDEHVFVLLYAVFGSYFAGVMVRLMLTLTPIVCVAAAIALSRVFDIFLKGSGRSRKATSTAEGQFAGESNASAGWKIQSVFARSAVVTVFVFYLCLFVSHCTWVTSNAYSSPSVVLQSRTPRGQPVIIDDYREAYQWLRQNTDYDARVMAWWDYGYQIGGMADRATLVDNNTWNNTHIATVGKAMASTEEVSYPIMQQHDVDYVLVVFGGAIGFSGDDINKFLWMVRIAEGIWPDEVKETNYFTPQGHYRVDDQATATMRNSVMYKLSYHDFQSADRGYDKVRGVRVPPSPELTTLEPAFTTANWIIRIYKVKKTDPFGRDHKTAVSFDKAGSTPRKYVSQIWEA